MTLSWLSYVPQHVAQDILARPHASPIGRQQRFDVVALFADVSGFTAMSEALGRSGKVGTEELTGILNSYFGPMIALVESYGGIIGKFGGDAMTVLFPYTAPNQAEVVRRAVQCAIDMQARMVDYADIETSGGRYGLAMKAGLAMGSVICTSVGDPEIRLEYLIAGKVLDDCADAEHHATKGEVVVHDALLPYLGNIDVVEQRGGFVCLSGLHNRPALAPLKKTDHLSPASIQQLATYLHPAIAERVRTGQSSFINEHRKVTVLFVRFSGFDYDYDPSVTLKLQAYLSQVLRVIHRYDGYLNKVDMGDKGSKYVVLFGAPVAHEDDEERALRCALELVKIPDAQISVGVNTGFVYSGQVGSESRQEYTVMGDVVNMAARLMQAAQPGQILTSQVTQRAVEALFEWGEMTLMQFKGKSEPIPVCSVNAVRQDARTALHAPLFNLPMVGRRHELATAEAKIRQALDGRGQIIGITAEAGMGKSRLTAEIVSRAAQHGLVGFAGECQSFGTETGYLVWHNIWRDFFGVNDTSDITEQTSQLETRLNQLASRFNVRLPLLGAALNLNIADNAFTRPLDPKVRSELLEALLIECLRIRAAQAPLLLVLEDCHWIDPLSAALLTAIARNISNLRVLIVGAYRPPQLDGNALEGLHRLSNFEEISLKEFTPDEAARLIEIKLSQLSRDTTTLPGTFITRITERAQGNPFYIEELLNLVHDRGLNLNDSEALENLDLPDSLNSLIISRIDQLAEQEKLTMKVAAVIGRIFKANWVWGSMPDIGSPAEIQRQLVRLSGMELTLQEKPEPELEYLFKHVITQEVAYESLAYATRQTLHEQIARYIEQSYKRDLRSYVNLLAYHYGRSQNTDKQRQYFRMAGDLAKAAYANDAAIHHYQRLVPLLPESEQAEILRFLGDIRELTGQWGEAETAYRDAIAAAEKSGDTSEQAWGSAFLGRLLTYKTSPAEAEPWLERSRDLFVNVSDGFGLSRALKYLGIAYLQQGKYAEALACTERQHKIASERGDQIGISEANMNYAWAYRDQNDFDRALEYLEEALAIAKSVNHVYGMIAANSDMAGIHFFKGDYANSITACQRAYEDAQQIGLLSGAGAIIGNMGEIYRQEGYLDNALICYNKALYINIQIGNVFQYCVQFLNIAVIRIAHQQYESADWLLERAYAIGRGPGFLYGLCEMNYHWANVGLNLGTYAVAASRLNEALEVAAQIGRRDIVFQAQILQVKLDRTQHSLSVDEVINRLLGLLASDSPENEQAALYYAAWEYDTSRNDLREKAVELYRGLYAITPTVEAFERLRALGADNLPPAPQPLPPLPDSITENLPDLEALLAQVSSVPDSSATGQ